MEPPCGQSIVKCEKQKDDGRMETQKRKQNEKEKAERRMKIVAGLGSVDEYIPYVQAGADKKYRGSCEQASRWYRQRSSGPAGDQGYDEQIKTGRR